ncbi:DUF6538 domain-containing protein [Zavarzinia aquatilis]|uniref:Recombinase XerD n=1 Tax=Zavarzinia aquatilis TaxID=2211142 RepID=A0A317EDS5_9PROT|nr:DUF6538 domain-containing protein [Zavarzinia aquatilis]PWR24416.1 recombinase XerD [Zavarzinia aquatilis]
MLFRLVQPMKREGSNNRYFRRRIPADILERARGLTLVIPVGKEAVSVSLTAAPTHVKVSLRTADPSEVKARHGAVAAHLERIWQGLRNGPRSLTNKEAVALAGEIYRRWTEALEANPGSPDLWRRVRDMNQQAQAGEYGLGPLLIGEGAQRRRSLEDRFGAFVDLVLGWHAIPAIDDTSRTKLLEQVAKAMDLAASRLEANAEGDYSPDANLARFPSTEAAAPASRPALGKSTLSALLEGWWKEARAAGLKESTHASHKTSVAHLRGFLGHDDAARVTPDDIIRFKDHRLAEGVSAKTVKDSDLSGLKAVFAWAANNRRLPSNPAHGVTVKVPPKARLRTTKGFTDDEANAVLAHARHSTPNSRSRRSPKIALACRWVPWLCAYTGARVGEMAQLRKQDLVREGDHWGLRITPEAGTVKTNIARVVALHQDLIAQGFPAFVEEQPDGYLFLPAIGKDDVRGPWRSLKNRLVEFVREVVTDPEVQPNHGWRHRFETLGRKVGIPQDIRDYMVGHAGKGQGFHYGDFPLVAQARELAKVPPYRPG